MSEQKMDLLKWQASANFDEEASELANNYSKKLYLLTFGLDKKGTNIVSQVNGRIVFVERDFQYEVGIDETWICTLKEHINCSYATPVVKMTLNNILNFNEQLRENVLSAIWGKHREDLVSIFESRYLPELQSRVAEELKQKYDERLALITREKDEIENELLQTRFQLDSRCSAASRAGDDFVILGSDDTVSGEHPLQTPPASGAGLQTEQIPSQTSPGVHPSPGVPRSVPQITRAGPVAQKFEVERIGPDSIRSPSFTDNRYFVHISPDYKVLVIRPNEGGNVYAINNIIRLRDLGLVSGFTVKKTLVAEYSELYGGMAVRL